MTYKTITDVRLNDATVQRMMQESMSMSDIVIQLANEKAELIRAQISYRMMHPPHIVMTRPGMPNLPHTPSIHTPHIPPNTPQCNQNTSKSIQ